MGWGRRVGRGAWDRGFIAPWEWRAAKTGLLGLQQPPLGLLMLSAPLCFQAAVIPFFLSPLQAGR